MLCPAQDGGAGKTGVLQEAGTSDGWRKVKWDEGGRTNGYRVGAEACHDLRVGGGVWGWGGWQGRSDRLAWRSLSSCECSRLWAAAGGESKQLTMLCAPSIHGRRA